MTTTAKRAKNTDANQEVFKDALKYYEEALKSGIQLQEDTLKLWKDVLAKVSSPDDLRKKLEEVVDELLPKSRERAEDMVALFQDNAKHCTDLMSKTFNVYTAPSFAEGQNRFQDLIETSLAAMRSNVHAVVDANAKTVKAWDGLFSQR